MREIRLYYTKNTNIKQLKYSIKTIYNNQSKYKERIIFWKNYFFISIHKKLKNSHDVIIKFYWSALRVEKL